MKPLLKDTLGLGIGFWVIGYLISIVLYFTPVSAIMGWIIFAVLTPVVIVITWWWFKERDLALPYYAGVGIAWTMIAVVFDDLFIVMLFNARNYYQPDVLVYYAAMFLIPAGVGVYLQKCKKK